ncbi:MAG TPA: TetR/AcrR family transcriptional regulator [Burkholderiaceae bacterium]|nr:TetR/AcrR family transcriptional regulator [Burkholderiaceae bacterium]
MARPRKDEIHSDNRRDDLIVAAARLFREKGYRGATMRDIGRAINMRSGSPFYHFASKQDLLYACIHDGLRTCLVALEGIDRRDLAAEDYFRALTRMHLAYLLESRDGIVPLVVGEWHHLEGPHREAVLDLRRRFESLWLGAFTRLKEARLVGRADQRACWYYLGAMHAVTGWYRPGGRMSVARIADDLADWVLGGPGVAR